MFTAGGTFTTGTPFKGTLNSKNQMTVSVEGSKCELTYALKGVGKPTPIDAAEAAAAAEKPAAAGAEKPAAAGAADSKAPAEANATAAGAPKAKSAAATSSAPVLLAVLCAVLAFLL